jgi:hypothetical protein
MGIEIHPLSISTLNRGQWSASSFDRFAPKGINPVSMKKAAGSVPVTVRTFWRREDLLQLLEVKHQTTQPVA